MSVSRTVDIYHASAGSGKTTQLLNCVEQHLNAGTPLHRIAFVTFSRKAAQVATERVCKKFGIKIEDALHFSTIHAMCFRALGCTKKQMMDDEKYLYFGEKAGYDFKTLGDRAVVDWGSLTAKQMEASEMLALEQLYETNRKMGQLAYDRKVRDGTEFTRFCREYERFKQTFGYRDFTDLLKMYLMREDVWEDVDVACIDEAQDCSPLQWQVLLKAFRTAKAIYVAGDDKQELFAYAGADSRVLTNMRGTPHIMPYSYRVPSVILSYTQTHIVESIKDVVKTDVKAIREGGKVKQIFRLSDVEEGFMAGKSYMLLARTRALCKEYVDFCKQHALPYMYLGKLWLSQEKRKKWADGKDRELTAAERYLCGRYEYKGRLWAEANITIDTIHAVKGDEADVVVVMSDLGRNAGKAYAGDAMTRNWEHKAFYVACTRAREALYIMEPKTRTYYREVL